jgi:hypothetical protein
MKYGMIEYDRMLAALKAVVATWNAPLREYPDVVRSVLVQCKAAIDAAEKETE